MSAEWLVRRLQAIAQGGLTHAKDPYDAERYDADRYDAERYDAERYDADRYDADRYDAERYDADRYERVRAIAAEVAASPRTEATAERVEALFAWESGYATP